LDNFISSGPQYKAKFYIDISRFDLKDDWINHVYWWDDLSKYPKDYKNTPIPNNVRTKIIIKPFSEQ